MLHRMRFSPDFAFYEYSTLFVRCLMNDSDGYESRQPCKANETVIFVATLISLQISQLTDMFLRKMRLRSILLLRRPTPVRNLS